MRKAGDTGFEPGNLLICSRMLYPPQSPAPELHAWPGIWSQGYSDHLSSAWTGPAGWGVLPSSPSLNLGLLPVRNQLLLLFPHRFHVHLAEDQQQPC